MRLANLKIGSRLGIGFALVVITSAMIGLIALRNMGILWSEIESLYKHPLAVSKSVRDIRTNIVSMHRSMKDVALAVNDIQIDQAETNVQEYERQVYKSFEIVFDRFLGDISDVQSAFDAFSDWKHIRDEVLVLSHAGKRKEAAAITIGKGADHVKFMNAKIQTMIDFANQKGDAFYEEANQTQINTTRKMILLILLTFSVGTIVAVIITRGITAPLALMSKVSQELQTGDYSARNRITTKDETGFLAQFIDALASSIQNQLEVKDNTANIINTMITVTEMSFFRKNLINLLVSITNSNVGAFYVLNEEKKQFEPSASIGFDKKRLQPFDAKTLEGEFGSSLNSRKITHVRDIPADTIFQFKAVAGTALPRDIITIPMIVQKNIVAMMSLASVNNYTEQTMELLEQAWPSINTAYSNVISEDRTRQYAKVLESSEARVRQLLDSTAEGIYGLDLDGNCTFTNPACLSILGYKDDKELLGKNMHDLIHHTLSDGTPYAMTDCRIYKAFREGEGSHADDEVLWHKDGSSFHAEYWSLPIRSEDTIVGSVVTFLDITDRKKAEEKIITQNQELETQSEELQEINEELQQQREELEESNIELVSQRNLVEDANRMKSEFLSNMSHEIRTPLTSILALSRVVIDQTQETLSKEQTHYLEIVERNGVQLLQLINDILDLSRIEAGYVDLNPKSFHLAGIINVVVESLTPMAKDKGLKLKVDIPADLPELESDETRVHQILMNIIGNALKFTHKGTVNISAQCDDEQMIISTKDTGIGIAADKLSSIFQEFHQVDASTSRSYEGTGLGLAIACKSARIMGGDITVESILGKGSTFTFTLPLKWPESLPVTEILSTAIPATQELLSAVRTGQRILLVDDQEAVINQVSTILEKAGYTVDVARGGQETLEYLRSTIPDGIILDLMMPDVDGFDVLMQIRESKATAKVPVLVLTAKDLTPDDLKKLKSNKIQQLIQKGDVNKKQLVLKVQMLLGNKSETIQEKTKSLTKNSQEAAKKKAKLPRRVEKPRKATPTVLIVEDNPDNLTTIKAMLKDKYKLLEARDGEQGLKVALLQLPDLVILDMMLPKMDGFEVVKKIKADKKAKGIPVIALTAKAMKGDREKILAAGCDDYIPKPVYQKIILKKLEEWLA